MKQTLTELAEIMCAVDAGAEWECEIPQGGWSDTLGQDTKTLFQLVSYGWAIRLKPAEPDAEGWIPWHGGECPVQKGVLVDVKYRDGSVQSKLPANTHINNDDYDAGPLFWERDNVSNDIIAYRIHKEPEPDPHPNRAEVEEGIKQGRKWQFRPKDSGDATWLTSCDENPQWLSECEYRLEPEPEYVPLGPEDVPPFSLIRKKGECQSWHWRLISYVLGNKIVCADRGYDYPGIMQTHEINRSLPLTGKWDPEAWEPCRKLKGGDHE